MSEVETREKITGEVHINAAQAEDVKKSIQNIKDLSERLKNTEETQVTETFSLFLASALALQVSDIHLESLEENVKARFRVDGILQDIGTIPLKLYESLLSRIKLVSGIKLNVADRPQDGRFSFDMGGTEVIEVRVSTLPSEYGESVVMRVLNPKSLLTLKDLGLRSDLLELFSKEIKKPNGMIIVTGPTGSGKTTTLYAFLKTVQNPEIKTITIEDPIEYHLEGISQTQVHPEKGYTFASGLAAIVRQDPDVVLVGEIRDGQTAEIAVQAALTGHLVFSTLHTNDAAGTIARMSSLGVQAIGTVASALNLIVAQRLVRKVCGKCSTLAKATKEELQTIREAFLSLTKESLVRLRIRVPAALKIPQATGCLSCNNTGFKGRVGIFEAIVVDDYMESYILTNPSIGDLRETAQKRGMITMEQDGYIKVVEGITTIQEIQRVTTG
ncbi:MAG: type II/IV secretion system protein [Candidatus Wildermuthbacteria bacterium]|nr:type II/IV secretion system protein [Candidatus Wildermuthbacteria bacterium]